MNTSRRSDPRAPLPRRGGEGTQRPKRQPCPQPTSSASTWERPTACWPLRRLEADEPTLELLPVPQLVGPSTVEARTMLPSFLYLARPHEDGDARSALGAGRDFAIGEFARRQAAEVPDRAVAAAKSWLCYSHVDRRQPILPWNAPADVPKVSPVAAAQRYLEHLAAAWEAAHPEAPIPGSTWS